MNYDVKPIDLDREPATKFELWWWDTWLYRNVVEKIGIIYLTAKKHWRWHRDCVSKVSEFDGVTSLMTLRYHLERVLHNMESGWHPPDHSNRSLRIALRLLGRLDEEKNDREVNAIMEAKWGKFIHGEDENGFWWAKYENETQPDDKITIMQERQALNSKYEARYDRNLKRFWMIFAKYHKGWWD